MVLRQGSQLLSGRGVHFLVFCWPLARQRAPTVGPGVPQDPQSVRKWRPRVPKMHPKSDLGGLGHAKGTPRGLRGTPPEEKDLKKTQKLTSGRPVYQKICSSCVLTVGLRKDIGEVISAVNFTCCSFRVKPQYGYDARKKISRSKASCWPRRSGRSPLG